MLGSVIRQIFYDVNEETLNTVVTLYTILYIPESLNTLILRTIIKDTSNGVCRNIFRVNDHKVSKTIIFYD